jgi:hypothetical protein
MSTNTLQPHAQRVSASRGAVQAKAEYKRADAARTAAWEAHRLAMEAGVTVPTFVVPNGRVQLRFHGACPFCRGSMFEPRVPAVDLERPHVSLRGTVHCIPCGRVVANLTIGAGAPQNLTCACGRQYPRFGECRPCREKEAKRRATRASRDRQRALAAGGAS